VAVYASRSGRMIIICAVNRICSCKTRQEE
jgi:hypothetical protein